MRKYLHLLILPALLLLSSCDYKELMELEINSNKYTFNQDQVVGYYQNISSQNNSVVSGDDGSTVVTIRVRNNVSGTYVCNTGVNPMAQIDIYYDGTTYSTTYAGSSGTIELLQTGSNLIEGTFTGVIKDNSNSLTITVTNGKFSGRAY